jgi:RNA polymerase sigma-70 factor (ECF subfamily)
LEEEAELDDLLTAARAGDRAAFGRIVTSHQSMVFSIGLHFLRNPTLAEEVAQDVFLELYRSLARVSSGAHLRAWLRRTALHRCIDESRRKQYRGEISLDAVAEHGIQDRDGDLLAYEQMRQYVAALPEMHRSVVILRYQEEMDPAEIAETLCIPLNTVKSRLHRALLTLRHKLERRARLRA